MTHVRIEMNNKMIDVAVAVSLSGRYSLKDLVTNPGGSEASVKGDGNEKNSFRGQPGSLFGIGNGNGFSCTNIGFNHLQAGGGMFFFYLFFSLFIYFVFCILLLNLKVQTSKV